VWEDDDAGATGVLLPGSGRLAGPAIAGAVTFLAEAVLVAKQVRFAHAACPAPRQVMHSSRGWPGGFPSPAAVR